MGRDAKCPRCDFKAPTVSFLKAADEGLLIVAVLKLPPAIQGHYLSYFSLFHPKSGCAVSISKAERLTNELAELVNKGYVSQKGQIDRSCPPRLWAMAMEQMLERAGSLTLPLKTHGYLKTIAYDLATKENSGQEQITRSDEARGQSSTREALPDAERTRLALEKKWEKEQAEWDKKNAGKLEKVMGNLNLKGMD